MTREERQKAILELMSPTVPIQNRDLIERFQVTDMTIRRDLDALAAQGKLIRIHGGAILVDANKNRSSDNGFPLNMPSGADTTAPAQASIEQKNLEPTYISRAREHCEQKKAIGHFCLQMLKGKKYVYLDSGSTTYSIAQMITPEYTCVFISNGINIINELLLHDYPSVIAIGGEIDLNTWSTRGTFAENQVRPFHADITFLGCNAISPEGSVMIGNMTEVGLKRAIMDISNEIYLVVDSSKFDRYSLTTYASVVDFNGIITDALPTAATHARLEAMGARLLVAE